MTDEISGLLGADEIGGEEGSDQLFGGADIDRLFGGSGADVLGGGNGNDQLWAAASGQIDASADALNGNQGTNTCTGSLSLDSFFNCGTIREEPQGAGT